MQVTCNTGRRAYPPATRVASLSKGVDGRDSDSMDSQRIELRQITGRFIIYGAFS
jgi:hypothetical protein